MFDRFDESARRHSDHQPEIVYAIPFVHIDDGSVQAYSDDYVYPTMGADPKLPQYSLSYLSIFTHNRRASITLSEKIVVNQKNKVYNGLCMFRNVHMTYKVYILCFASW